MYLRIFITGTLNGLIAAANYLDIQRLLDITAVTISNTLSEGKEEEEVRKWFNIQYEDEGQHEDEKMEHSDRFYQEIGHKIQDKVQDKFEHQIENEIKHKVKHSGYLDQEEPMVKRPRFDFSQQ